MPAEGVEGTQCSIAEAVLPTKKTETRVTDLNLAKGLRLPTSVTIFAPSHGLYELDPIPHRVTDMAVRGWAPQAVSKWTATRDLIAINFVSRVRKNVPTTSLDDHKRPLAFAQRWKDADAPVEGRTPRHVRSMRSEGETAAAATPGRRCARRLTAGGPTGVLKGGGKMLSASVQTARAESDPTFRYT
jgi:hypothetical protein